MIVKKSHFALSLCFVLLSSFCMSCQKKETFTNWKDNSTPINELINYVEKEGEDLKVDITFDKAGHKRLMAKFANLEIIE